MRGLQLQDAFTVIRILKKMNINKDTLKGMTSTFDPKSVDVEGLKPAEAKKKIEEAKIEQTNAKGAEVLMTILENIGDAEEDLYKFIADLKEFKDPNLIRTMSFEELGKLFEEFKEMKGLNGFFTQVMKFMK